MRLFFYSKLYLILFMPAIAITSAQALEVERIESYGGALKGVSANGSVIVGQFTDVPANERQAFRIGSDGLYIPLGTLKSDNSGQSDVSDVSANGRVVIGVAENDANEHRAFRHNEGDAKITDLGSLKVDNTGNSISLAVSGDGRMVVGWAASEHAAYQAFRHNEGDIKMTGLGSLKTDNSGLSMAVAVSADGKVVVGDSATDGGTTQAFRHNEGDAKMTGLGTLKTDNTGYSAVVALSANGKTVVGAADTDGGDTQAFRHNESDARMTGLGSLKTDNTGRSRASAVSSDGRVVVGHALTDGGTQQAFRHNEGDARMTGLGTLKTDNSGISTATAVSGDGRIVVGNAENDVGDTQAFWHREGDARMTGLGTLKADNSGSSEALAISADGRVVLGNAENSIGNMGSVIWRIVNGSGRAVDVDNTKYAMLNTAQRSDRVLGLYQSQLGDLVTRCNLNSSEGCLGVLTGFTGSSGQSLTAAGLTGAVSLPGENLSAGATLQVPAQTRFMNNYETRGNCTPSLGAWLRYDERGNGEGPGVELAGSWVKQDITIIRDQLLGTERGHGNSSVDGVMARIQTDYGIRTGNTLLRPSVSLSWSDISRDGYTEVNDIDFPAAYGKTGIRQIDIGLNLNVAHHLNDLMRVQAAAGADIRLGGQRDVFTGQIDYVGAYAQRDADQQDFRPYLRAGLSAGASENGEAWVNAGWMKTAWGYDALNTVVGYTYRF